MQFSRVRTTYVTVYYRTYSNNGFSYYRVSVIHVLQRFIRRAILSIRIRHVHNAFVFVISPKRRLVRFIYTHIVKCTRALRPADFSDNMKIS